MLICEIKWHTFILVFDSDFVAAVELAAENALHHEQELVVGDVFIVDGDAADIIAQLSLDDQLPTQVQLAIHTAEIHRRLLKHGTHYDYMYNCLSNPKFNTAELLSTAACN